MKAGSASAARCADQVTSIFDGIAGMFTDVLGATVNVNPDGASPFDVQGIFRTEPLDVIDENGRGTLILSPTLKVTADQAALISEGDVIRPDGASDYVVVNGLTMGSPASDALHVFELEDLASG